MEARSVPREISCSKVLLTGGFPLIELTMGTSSGTCRFRPAPRRGPSAMRSMARSMWAVSAGWSGSIAIIGGMAPTHRATSRLLVFRLGGTAKLPPLPPEGKPDLPPSGASGEVIARGAQLYSENCRLCHGAAVVSGGMTPDLRFMSAQTHREFDDIVLYGKRAGKGMRRLLTSWSPRMRRRFTPISSMRRSRQWRNSRRKC